MVQDKLRSVVLRPYRKGTGPVFRLELWDTNTRDEFGKYRLGYRLKMDCNVLFEGEDFCCSPMHAVDSDESVASLLGFLTLRPGDTDSEYFADYTPDQLDYCSQHAESLAFEVISRFGEY